MLDLMYRLPDQEQGGKYVITDAVVEQRENLFEIKAEPRRKESA
jgi:ATP-dependent protease Clp ATPase subunit